MGDDAIECERDASDWLIFHLIWMFSECLIYLRFALEGRQNTISHRLTLSPKVRMNEDGERINCLTFAHERDTKINGTSRLHCAACGWQLILSSNQIWKIDSRDGDLSFKATIIIFRQIRSLLALGCWLSIVINYNRKRRLDAGWTNINECDEFSMIDDCLEAETKSSWALQTETFVTRIATALENQFASLTIAIEFQTLINLM